MRHKEAQKKNGNSRKWFRGLKYTFREEDDWNPRERREDTWAREKIWWEMLENSRCWWKHQDTDLSWQFPRKFNIHFLYDPPIPLLGIYLPNGNEKSVRTNTWMQMLVPEVIIPNPGNKVFFNWRLGCISYLMLCKNYLPLPELGGYILQQTAIIV